LYLHNRFSNTEALELKSPLMAKRKNPAAVKLGRLGGLKSAAGRMKKLTPQQRSEIARNAVLARWKKANKSR
jgi:hypothetical protein